MLGVSIFQISFLIFFFAILFIHVCLAALGLGCFAGPLSGCGVQASCGAGFSCCDGSLGLVDSRVVAHGLSCSEACALFPDLGSNLYLLHCKVDS